MLLAPRHPERFDDVARLISSCGVPPGTYPHLPGLTRLNFWRRSQLDPQAALRGGVLLLDSIGELAAVYSLATIAFVGGSLVPRGGHNIVEPAYFGVPILVGPHVENFRDIIAIFQAANAVKTVRGFRVGDIKADLSEVVLQLLEDAAERPALGRRAAEVLKLHTGATERTAKALQELLTAAPSANPLVTERSIQ